MPELPEVETTRRGIAPHLLGRCVRAVVIRNPHLRWTVPLALTTELPGQTLHAVERRAKYLLLRTGHGTVIVHLGMSGSLRVVDESLPAGPYDHVDLVFSGGKCLRLRDPRRFGAILWTQTDPAQHALLRDLGPEPLAPEFTAAWLGACMRGRRAAVRDLLLNARIVAGVGNIYANEALFRAGIRPGRRGGRLSHADCSRLVSSIRVILRRAIAAGGTTLRDFQNAEGDPGHFQRALSVYGRVGNPCRRCGTPVKALAIGQRRAFFCPHCQR